MPQYELHALCSECGAVHPMRIKIHLEQGPTERQSIARAFEGKSLPPQVAAVEHHKILCLKTGKTFVQHSPEQIFLVPSYF
ncbi:MAG TPA: hypothetical protein VNN77_08075 [candidate division Zixibacteria bacterium]|nr:hypothetical protein [candidate division Zixibacteria bacterium]